MLRKSAICPTARRPASSASGLNRSTFRVAYTRSALQPNVSSLINRFHGQYPDTYVELRSGWTRLNFEDLLLDRIDVAFKSAALAREEPYEALMTVAKGHGMFALPEAWAMTLQMHRVVIKPSVAPELPLLVGFNDKTATPNVGNFIQVARSLRVPPVI